ncbi:MAG: VPLPA-CTERM sorting domain-containing protein [Pikeienuella sp.]
MIPKIFLAGAAALALAAPAQAATMSDFKGSVSLTDISGGLSNGDAGEAVADERASGAGATSVTLSSTSYESSVALLEIGASASAPGGGFGDGELRISSEFTASIENDSDQARTYELLLSWDFSGKYETDGLSGDLAFTDFGFSLTGFGDAIKKSAKLDSTLGAPLADSLSGQMTLSLTLGAYDATDISLFAEGYVLASADESVGAQVPLPASAPLLLAGLAGFAALRRRGARV